MAQPFVHLRVRSPYSLLEGSIRIKETAKLCTDFAMPAAALTDSNNLFGALEFSETLSGAGVQPIIGCTLSVQVEAPRPGERSTPDGTIVLLAKDQAGYNNLMKLSSAAYLEVGPTDEAHISLKRLLGHAEGLICLTGGHDGVLNRLACAGRTGPADAVLDQLQAAFADRLYIELQRHGRPDDVTAEDYLVERAYARALPLVATNEPYFVTADKHGAHDALLCIAEGAYVSQTDRRQVTAEHYFKSGEAMAERFSDLPEAVENTLEIARRCAFRPRTGDPILPSFPTEGDRDEAEELRAQARAGLDARLAKIEASAPRAEYDERLDYELGIIERMGFPGYFLIVSDFIKWAKANDIPVGPGRGSGAGSLVAWALTITDLDPLRFGLLFERFLNPERVSMPDFDVDFCQDRRGEVIRYVKDQYGADRVAQIITFGTLQARAVVRDVGRVLQLPFGLVDRIAKLVPNNPAQPTTLAEAVQQEPKLQAMREEDEQVARLIEVALQLEGMFRNASTHAAGVVIGDRPLTELVPLYQDPRSDLPATQFNMKWVEPAGLVKFDFLGLKTLTVIARALDYIEQSGHERPDMDALGFDDPATYELLSSGGSIGVFQLESTGMRDTLRKLKPDTIEDVIALISLYRPGPMKNIDVYVDRKFGRAEPDYLHPDLEKVLKETFGVIIYQEQVMQIAQILSGYSLGEADLLRRAMGKKKPEEMAKQRVRFQEGAQKHGLSVKEADHIFDLVAEFAGYGFNKSHAAAYALIAYRTGWLKANHPVAFMAALMSLDMTNTDKLAVFFQETRRMGLDVLPPDVNASQADFSVEEGKVRYALGAIRNVGFSAMEHVVAVRGQGGRFKDIYDFAERVDPRQVNKRAFENLARSGAFDSLEPDRARALASAETLLGMAQKAHQERESAQVSLFGGAGEGASGLARPRLPDVEPWDPVRRLDEELAAVGFYLSGHPLDDMGASLARRGVVLFADLPAKAAEGARAARMAAMVRRKQEKVSRRSGEKFAFVTLSDPSGEFEALVPPKVLREVRDVLEPGGAVLLAAKIEDQDEGLRLIIDGADVLDPNSAEHNGTGVRIHVDDPATLAPLKSRIERADGREGPRGGVHLVMPLSDGRTAEIRLPGRHAIDPAARAAFKAVQGVLDIEQL
ncbi:MAG: DNA polymerase III subunit alpha [Oceanicaulis sp.]